MNKKIKLILVISLFGIIIGSSVSTIVYFYYTPIYLEDYPVKQGFFWYAAWNNLSRDRLYESYEEIEMISPVWWNVFENGTIKENVLQWMNETNLFELVDFCKEKQIGVHPLVSNYIEDFSGNLISVIINNETKVTNFISSANALLDYYNLSGINLDFEGVPAEDREVFSEFLQRTRNEIDAKYNISIDVPAKTWDNTVGWSGAFDYEKIGEYCDMIMIMTYDFHYTNSLPGEIAPRSWVRRALKYACKVIQHDKIYCGIPLYGYTWPDNGNPANSYAYSYFDYLTSFYEVEPKRTRDAQEIHITYTDSQGTTWDAYYPDATTTFKKEAEINKFPIGGYCYWYLGLEDPDYWM